MEKLLEGPIEGVGRPFFSLEGRSARAKVKVVQVIDGPMHIYPRPTFFTSNRPMNEVGTPVACTGNRL